MPVPKDHDDVVVGTDDLPEDEFSDDSPPSQGERKRKRTGSMTSHSSPPAGWTRNPPKAAPKKKKKLIAGRELRDRKQRKTYAESSSSDEDFEEFLDNDDEDQKDKSVEEDPQVEGEFEEVAVEPAPRTRKIILRLKSDVLQEISQGSLAPEEEAGPNGNGDVATGVSETNEDLEAEIIDLKEEVSVELVEVVDEDDEDYQPRRLTRRSTRQSSFSKLKETINERPTHGRKGVTRQDGSSGKTNGEGSSSARRRRLEDLSRKSYDAERKQKKKPHVSESEFEDDGEEEPDDDLSAASENDGGRASEEDGYSSPARPAQSSKKMSSQSRTSKSKKRSRRNSSDEEDESLVDDVDDLEAELREIGAEIPQRQRQLRPTERMNYFIPPPPDKDDLFFTAGPSPTKKRANAGRGFGGFSGFGGDFSGLGLADRFRGIAGLGTAGGADDSSDSDDDARQRRPSAALGSLIPSGGGVTGLSGTPANLGKYTPKSKLADADPLAVDQNIDFTAVGGLDDYITHLKEMVTLPLLYPEIFQRFNVTPPRGVLFHGPPGTGKTLMARALAASCSTEGRKIAFFMRKGADCLSKWVGEAERQLRLLFEEAKNSQPSIIFFDEIDGLAPVRSSKQEQIHASIVSTLLALMDGMDGRGQVIVIGATNRPDAVDPALRRPGRFDREFYFPLPDVKARKGIIDIHTGKWDPPLDEEFKAQLAVQTKGYAGADIRALCTEAALNAVQRRYPQIYSSTDKLLVDPKSINVIARDFMIAMDKIVPSSERSSSSGAAPLPKSIKPLLESKLEEIKSVLAGLIPEKKKRNILEEAIYEDDGPGGFESEVMMQAFESARTFRPRLLIVGDVGMGQQYLGAAILHHLEKTHVQSFDLATLMGDSARTPESALVQLFVEVKRHKPSVIYLPNMDLWFRTISDAARETFMTLIRGISPSDPILLLGLVEAPLSQLDPDLRALFGYSLQNRVELTSPSAESRHAFFKNALENLDKAPSDFPDAVKKRKRVLEILEKAPPPPPKVWTKAELQEQALKDNQTKNLVKLKLSALMDLLKKRYQRFRKPVIDDKDLALLARGEQDPDCLALTRFRRNEDGTIRDVTSNKKFYNTDLDLVNDRLWNGYYLTPDQFVYDIQCIVHDSKTWPDRDRANRAEEMLVNVQSYVSEGFDETLILECQRMAEREYERQKILQAEKDAKKKKRAERAEEKARLAAAAAAAAAATAAAQEPVERDGPTKLIEGPPDVQTTEVNGDGADGTMTSVDIDDQFVPESSPFGSQSIPPDANARLEPRSVSPMKTQPYELLPQSDFNPPFYNAKPNQTLPYIRGAPAMSQPPQYPQLPHSPHQFPVTYQANPGMYSQPTYTETASTHQFRENVAPNMGNYANTPQQNLNSNPPHHQPLVQFFPPQPGQPAGQPTYSARPPMSNHTQPPPVTPQRNPSPIRNPQPRPSAAPHPTVKRDPARVERLLKDVTHLTEGFTLEQLEQVYAACMDVIWRQRHEWDRTVAIAETEKCIRRVLNEIEMMKRERHQDRLDIEND